MSGYRSFDIVALLPCCCGIEGIRGEKGGEGEKGEIVDAKVNVTRLTSSNGECARQRMIGRPHPGEPGSMQQTKLGSQVSGCR